MSCPTSLSSFLGEGRGGDCCLSLSLNSLPLGAPLDTCKVNPANPPTFSSPFTLHGTRGTFSSMSGVKHWGIGVSDCSNQYLLFIFTKHLFMSLLRLRLPITYPLTCLPNLLLVYQILPPLSVQLSLSFDPLLLLSPHTGSLSSLVRAHPICSE